MATMTAAAQPAPNGYYTDAKGPNAPYHEKQAYPDPAPMNSHPQQGMGTMAGASSQGRTSTDSYDGEDAHLPTVLFAIPFPAATKSSSAKKPISPFLLYALPRAPYHKPLEDADGNKLEKEGFVKKAERKWQEEIAEGERIRKGEEPDAGNWKKFKGKATGTADKIIHWLPNSRIEALGRVPPKRKLGEISVLYPNNVPGANGQPIAAADVQAKLDEVLKQTQKSATIGAVGSAFLLPVTLTIDFFAVVPIFLFEMNIAYFSTQLSGRSKVSAMTDPHTALIATGSPLLAPVSLLLAETCHANSPKHFSDPNGSGSGGKRFGGSKGQEVSDAAALSAADALIEAFLENATPQVRERHILDRAKVAEDLKRCCAKASKEYVKRAA